MNRRRLFKTMGALALVAPVAAVGAVVAPKPKPSLVLHDDGVLKNATVTGVTVEGRGSRIQIVGNTVLGDAESNGFKVGLTNAAAPTLHFKDPKPGEIHVIHGSIVPLSQNIVTGNRIG